MWNLIKIILLIVSITSLSFTFEDVYQFKNISLKDGLSQSTINAIIQDRYGYMWFGTQDGLNRYDGYDFVVYRNDKNDPTSISDNWIWTIFEDSRGDLWIGTYNGGLNKFDRQHNKFIRYQHNKLDTNSLSNNNVISIVEDKSGSLWIGTWGGGLQRFDEQKNTFTRLDLKTLNVRCLLKDRNGLIWIGTWNGLYTYNPDSEHLSLYKHDPNNTKSISDDKILNIYEDKKGHIWISTLTAGLNLFDSMKNEFRRYQIGSNKVSQIAEDDRGVLWIATRGDGLILFDQVNGKLTQINYDMNNIDGVSDETIISIFSDYVGGIWLGTGSNGINYYNSIRNKFQQFKYDPNSNKGLNNPTVRAICEDRFGKVWIGTRGGGLNCYDKNTRKYIYYTHNPNDKYSLSDNSVMALLEDSQGNLWIGTEYGGLDLLNRVNNTFIHYQYNRDDSNSISSNNVMVIHEDRKGNLWIGTSGGGLNQFDNKKKKFFRYQRTGNKPNELSGNYIWSILEDKYGYLWIGTWGAGLNQFNPLTGTNKIYQYEPANQSCISSNTVQSIYEDSNGDLWIGTFGGGLNRFNRSDGTFTHFTQKDGLPNNVVYGILEDANGNLWLSTNKGLSCFNPKNKEFRNYDFHDGLQSNEFNQGAYFKNKKGDFFFGGINGVNSFNPKKIKKNNNVPKIVITNFRVFDKQVKLNASLETIEEIKLSYKENFFSFEFSALDYTVPEKNQYMYMLEGYDRDWINSGTRRYAAYTNLNGGNYIFKVKGSNGDGVWNNQGKTLKIVIIPPYWETWWARSLAALLLISLGYLFYRSRMMKLTKEKLAQQEISKRFVEFQEHERRRIASELHDSLGQNLLIIKNALSQFEGNIKTLSPEELHDISELAQESIDEVREISYDLHPHTLDRLGLKKAIQSCVKKFMQVSPIKFVYNSEEIDNLFSPIEEIHIFRIIQEALNNIVKHSGATECIVDVKQVEDILEIKISDNGKGFNIENIHGVIKTNEGFGISNIYERVRLLQGKIKINSSINEGTDIFIQIPIKRI